MKRAPALLGLATLALTGRAAADPSAGVDGALFRSSYDAGGVFAVEGARLLPKRDLSFKLLVSYARSPIDVAVPGIGGDTSADRILDYLVTLDMAFGMTLTDRLAIGFSAAAYRTATADGYGVRGRFQGGAMATPSTGLIALRPLSNIDPSASPGDESAYLGTGLAGPLDARLGVKLALVQRERLAITAIGSVFLPFGEDEMLLGDRDLVFAPALALEWRPHPARATRLVGNAGLRIRRRSVLESYDPMLPGATEDDARVFLDVGSEAVAGLGGVLELAPRAHLAAEAQVFVPLPDGLTWGSCRRHDTRRCSTITGADYFADTQRGDLAALVTAGAVFRVSADLTASVMLGTGQLGARGDDVRLTTGLVWSPQPAGTMGPGRADRDGDDVPDAVDGCREEREDRDGHLDEDGCPEPDNDGDGIADGDDRCANESEDRDGYEDEDGCPEPDNDGDGLFDAADRCTGEPEDLDGWQDEDGCPDDDNDGDGVADPSDRCPNDAETVNGFDDDDGCPDVRGTSGPEERADRIDLKGGAITFARGATLTAPARRLLDQVATLLKARRLAAGIIRIEVHVARGRTSTAAQQRKDRAATLARAKAIADYLVAQGVPAGQLQPVGVGSDRPLPDVTPTDARNERVELVKKQ